MGRIRFDGNKGCGAVRIGDFANLLDGEQIIIGDPLLGGKVFEWDDDAAVEDGSIAVTIGGSGAACATALAAAINANPPTGVDITAYIDPKDTSVVRLEATDAGARGNLAFTHDMADAGNIISNDNEDALVGGENGSTQKVARGTYIVTDLDVLADNIMIPTALQTPARLQIDVWSATGLQKALTTLWTISSNRIRGNFDGATDPVATDVIEWTAYGS